MFKATVAGIRQIGWPFFLGVLLVTWLTQDRPEPLLWILMVAVFAWSIKIENALDRLDRNIGDLRYELAQAKKLQES